jgi:metal-sulfur cluster biosynthetic enzyme
VVTEAEVWGALREILDPEHPVSIVDLGLVRRVGVTDGGEVSVALTFTAMACPCMGLILDDVRARLERIPGVAGVRVDVVWDRPWSAADLSPEAREKFRTWGVAP